MANRTHTPEYAKGWEAFANRKPLNTCPAERDSEPAKNWCNGWYDASRDPALAAEQGTEDYFHSRG